MASEPSPPPTEEGEASGGVSPELKKRRRGVSAPEGGARRAGLRRRTDGKAAPKKKLTYTEFGLEEEEVGWASAEDDVVGDLHFTSPHGGETWVKGETVAISWACSNQMPPAKLFYVCLIKVAGGKATHEVMLEVATAHAAVDDALTAATESGPRGVGYAGIVSYALPAIARSGQYFVEITTPQASVRSGVVSVCDPVGAGASPGAGVVRDVGVWCPCGATDDGAFAGEWVLCESCLSWQHCPCVEAHREALKAAPTAAAEEVYVCPWCSVSRPSLGLAIKYVGMLKTVFAYKQRHKGSMHIHTPPAIVRFARTLVGSAARCADLGAGSGDLSLALPGNPLCVETVAERVVAGRHTAPHGRWLHADVCGEAFMKLVLEGGEQEPFDVVITNPPFEHAFQFLYMALLMVSDPEPGSAPPAGGPVPHTAPTAAGYPTAESVLASEGSEALPCAGAGAPTEDRPQRRILLLAPSDFFEGAVARRRLYRVLGLAIVREHRLGRWCYYGKSKERRANGRPHSTMDKYTCDSMFELAVTRESKFSYMVHQSRLAGLLGDDKWYNEN